ncbi:hypothetical protein [Fluviicola chungangensis]|uniref:Uncharacterized protein n=1 Tax=Fluviicola chungangensis TaxID=2597671 RepID=A0A556MMP0_9FLAO|nr:hypothetical protein [Fluviicola chungangensis]TSJ41211.1 hypothetical protein FO442_14970 [Fluviicola chungangensis]
MKDNILLVAAGAVVLINGCIGHYFPPNGITLTPLILAVISIIIVFGSKLNLILKSTAIIVGIILNDYLIRNYSGGIHDSEGFAWSTLYLFYGLVLSYIILIVGVLNNKDTLSNKLISIFVFPVAAIFYIFIR